MKMLVNNVSQGQIVHQTLIQKYSSYDPCTIYDQRTILLHVSIDEIIHFIG